MMPDARIGLPNHFHLENSAQAEDFLLRCPFDPVYGAFVREVHAENQEVVSD